MTLFTSLILVTEVLKDKRFSSLTCQYLISDLHVANLSFVPFSIENYRFLEQKGAYIYELAASVFDTS